MSTTFSVTNAANQNTITLDGQTGWITAGGNGLSGSLQLIDAAGARSRRGASSTCS